MRMRTRWTTPQWGLSMVGVLGASMVGWGCGTSGPDIRSGGQAQSQLSTTWNDDSTPVSADHQQDIHILAAHFESDVLVLRVAHGEGCGTYHHYSVGWDGQIYESNPPLVRLSLSYASDNTCEAYGETDLRVPLEELLSQAGQPESLVVEVSSGRGDAVRATFHRTDTTPGDGGSGDPGDGSGDTPVVTQEGGVVWDSDPAAYGNSTTTIYDMSLEEDGLLVHLGYSGGCSDHHFSLVTDGSFLESNPVQLEVHIGHIADPIDHCEAFPQEYVLFDLSGAIEMFRDAYGSSGEGFFLNVVNDGERLGSVFVAL